MFSAVSVCQFVNMITSERLNIGLWNLAVRCIVQKSRPSSSVKVKGQGYQGQKKTKLPSHPHWQCIVLGDACAVGRTLHAAETTPLCGRWGWRGDGSARWRRLASGFVGSGPCGRGNASGKMSACCLVSDKHVYIYSFWYIVNKKEKNNKTTIL